MARFVCKGGFEFKSDAILEHTKTTKSTAGDVSFSNSCLSVCQHKRSSGVRPHDWLEVYYLLYCFQTVCSVPVPNSSRCSSFNKLMICWWSSVGILPPTSPSSMFPPATSYQELHNDSKPLLVNDITFLENDRALCASSAFNPSAVREFLQHC